jgi:putative DNA primase/helicase
LQAFFEKRGALARGTGFLSRFLIAWPASTQGTRQFAEPPASWPALSAFNRRLTEILNQPVPIDENGALNPALLCLTAEARRAWVAFHDAIEEELGDGGELRDVRDVASKSADNAARLAALFQVFEHGAGAVGVEAVNAASRIVAWHLNESRRFFGELALPPELANAAKLDVWLVEYCRREGVRAVSTRDVQQFGPGGLRDRLAIEVAVRELEAVARARLVQDGRRKSIALNPALLGEGGAG